MKRILTIMAAALMSLAAMATMVVVDGVHVRLRFSPSTTGEILTGEDGNPTYPPKGAMFEYLGTNGSFYKINYEGTPLYISRDFCHLKDEKAATKKATTQKAATVSKDKMVIVDGTNVRLRRSASLKGEIVLNEEGQTLYPKKGASFKYLGTSGNFYKIDYYGEELYISRDYCHIKNY